MKYSNILNVLLAASLVILSFKITFLDNKKGGSAPVVTQTDSITTTKDWQKVSVEEAHLDPFGIFQNAAALNVGKKGAMNSMTIGWGQLGIIWGHDTHTCTVYVRQSRFTKHLMDENETFTIETFPEQYNDLLMNYLGRVSGRDEDKIKKSGLTLRHTDNGAPAFEEGNLIIECRKLSAVDIPMDKMAKTVTDKWYSDEDKDNIHTQYVGEITSVWVKR